MAERVPDPPAPGPPDDRPPLFRPGPVDLREVFRAARDGLAHAPDVPHGWLPAWVLDELPALLDLMELVAAEPNDHVVHYDIRNDNLLQRPSGELVFLDWGAFGVGPAWLDPLLARLERVDTPWFDDSLASAPALQAAGDDVVTGLMAGMGAHLAWRAHSGVATNMPTLRDFRRAESARFLSAARRRLDLRR
jgi:aminoglycoside phosphotransferase (APT) family kinase protein